MQKFRGYYQSRQVDGEASNATEARDKAVAAFKAVTPRDRYIRPHLIAVIPLDNADNPAGKVPQ